MAKKSGRLTTISIDGTAVATARAKSLTINNSTIDVTAEDDSGIQSLLTTPGRKSVDVSVEGVTDTAVLRTLALNTDISAEVVFDDGVSTLTGTFMMTSYGESKPYEDADTFTASFSSSGAFVEAAVP